LKKFAHIKEFLPSKVGLRMTAKQTGTADISQSMEFHFWKTTEIGMFFIAIPNLPGAIQTSNSYKDWLLCMSFLYFKNFSHSHKHTWEF
jgi:hypothetical protein